MNLFNQIIRRSTVGLVLIAVLSTIPGCTKDFLARAPQGEYTQDTYPYPGGSGPYDQYIFSGYGELRTYSVSVMPFIAAVSIRSDDADKGSTPADGPEPLQLDNFTTTATNGLSNSLWTGYFSLINKANIVLDQIEKDPNPNTLPGDKIQAEAEAKFLRGYGYFMMVRLFGRVPLIDKIFDDAASKSNVPQSEAAAIYTLIEKDLQFAMANLPVSWEKKFIGRATKGAASGLLAKVYLTQQKWGMAMAAANTVITSGLYDLSTPYSKVFSEEGENSRESVFEVQATATASNQTLYGVQYANVQGVRGTGIWDLGWGFNAPSIHLEAAYESGDPRKARTILYAGGTSIHGEAVPLGLPNPRYNHKVMTNPGMRASVGNRFGWWMNIRVLRFSDVVLMYAEAANESGNTAEALAKLESVRFRARGGNNAVLPVVTTTDQALLRDAIRHERRVELAMEHDRFFDLVRWGIAAPVLQAAGKNFVAPKHNLMPIPQTQIDLSKGKLTQNIGY